MSKYIEKIGRRKTSSARVRLFQGSGASVINGRPVEEYFKAKHRLRQLSRPFMIAGVDAEKYYYTVMVKGGGKTGQIGSVILGLSRALASIDEDYRVKLRKEGLLTRDPRMVERKKVYLVKSRKRPQYSKR